MTSREYWRKRAIEREAFFTEHVGADLSLEIKRLYEKALPEIEKNIAALYGKFAGENVLTMAEARRLIRGKEFRQWRMSLLEYVKAAKFDSKILKELNTLAMRKRINRLEMLHAQTLQEIATLADKVDHKVESIFTRAYLDARYENLYDIQREVGLKTPPVAVDSAQVRQALLTPWSGKNYSQRIWRNAEKLATAIKETVVQAIHQGTSVQKLSQKLARRMEVGYSNAERLVRTELNYVMNRAAGDALRSADMEYYMFVATLDHRTTPRCRSLDGQVFPVEEMMQGENAPPMHVRCRSTIAASLGESLGRSKRVARDSDGRNIRVPEDMRYADWKKVYIDKSLSLKDWQDKRGRGKIIAPTGLKWSERFLSRDEVISGTNPKYSRGLKYQKNCSRCVPVCEMRFRGREGTARGAPIFHDTFARDNWNKVFKNAIIKKNLPGNGKESIIEEMIKWGDGSRSEICIFWDAIRSHVFMAENRNGIIHFFDPQTGELDVEYYFEQVMHGETIFFRIDNLEVDEKLIKECLEVETK